MTYYLPDDYGVCAHRLGLTGDPDDMFVTIGFYADTAVATVDQCAVALHDAFKTFWGARGSDQYTLKSTGVRLQLAGSPDPAVAEATSSQVGGSSSLVLPQNTAWLVRKNTGLGGRRNKGRMYVPGALETLVSPTGVVDSTFLASYNTSLATLLADYVSGPEINAMVLLHNMTITDPTPEPTVITSLTLDPIVATQRRRLRR